MNNYEYIIASLPALSRENGPAPDMKETVDFILSQCSDKDRMLVGEMLKGFDDSVLGEEFYREALGERKPSGDRFDPTEKTPRLPANRFIKEYFTFDLQVRNAKVCYLNKALGRPAGQDIFLEPEAEFPEAARLQEILTCGDILAREKGIDELMWDKIGSLATFHTFDIDAVLAFIAKLHIIDRWHVLDEATGREMFRRLVSEVKGTFKGVNYNPEI